jgi:hypothetical protein
VLLRIKLDKKSSDDRLPGLLLSLSGEKNEKGEGKKNDFPGEKKGEGKKQKT